MKESFAFHQKLQKHFKNHDVIIDVCGSHGLTSYLFALYCRTPHIYIIDSKKPKSFDVIGKVLAIRDGTIKYIEKDLYQGLPELLQHYKGKEKKVAVIACHACSHLSDAIMDICFEYDMTEFALMPCCHARKAHYHQVGNIVDTLNADFKDKGINAGMVKDLIMFGRGIQMGYSMRWRIIDSKITPQNRILFGLKPNENEKKIQQQIIDDRNKRMARNYQKQK